MWILIGPLSDHYELVTSSIIFFNAQKITIVNNSIYSIHV